MPKPDFAIRTPQPVNLPDFTDMRRIATRPAALRDADFDAQFDDEVLFFDVFYRQDGKIALVGPSLNNMADAIKAMTLSSEPGGPAFAFRVKEMDRLAQVIVDAPAGLTRLHMTCTFGATYMAVGRNEADAFAGKRVVITISKDNKLSWIREWLRFAHRANGADAVVIYDNGSTQYGPEELLEAVSSVDGLAAARIVPWHFKFGPQGTMQRGTWDSDYCQHGAWEHVRWLYLSAARSVQNSDIDELVISRSGRSNFAAAEADLFGMLRYYGRWIVGTNSTTIAARDPARTYADYDTVLKQQPARRFGLLPYDAAACATKWTVVPAKCPAYAQWKIHSIANWLPALRISGDFSFRHFREISDSWKYLRSDRLDFDPAQHERDDLMRSYFQRIG